MKKAYQWMSYLFWFVSVLCSLCIIGFSIFLFKRSIVEPTIDTLKILVPVSFILGLLEMFKKEKEKMTKISLILTALNLSFVGLLLWFGANLV